MKNWTFNSVKDLGNILVAGMGQTGIAAALWCMQHGGNVRLADSRNSPDGLQLIKNSPYINEPDILLGDNAFTLDAIDNIDTLVVSPGLSPVGGLLGPMVQAARDRGIDIVGETEIFARALADMSDQGYNPKVVAISGTNGKTTVTVMTHKLAEASGISSVVAGNISPSTLEALMLHIKNNTLPELWVLELSSFQLHTTSSLKLNACALLNIGQDHIDWHGSMHAYIEDKARILEMSNTIVFNRSDSIVKSMVEEVDSSKTLISFGNDSPCNGGDLGICTHDGMSWVCCHGKLIDESLNDLMPVEALKVRGSHNVLNAQAAIMLALESGANIAPVLHAIREYEGESHRTEYVRTVGGIDFINDSKGTNVDATVAAINGFDRPLILIAGGLAKGQDFTPLAKAASNGSVKHVVLIGVDANTLHSVLSKAGINCSFADDMFSAVAMAFDKAVSGDAVILSPACASMDMFDNYVHRGQSFVSAVREIALDHGEVA